MSTATFNSNRNRVFNAIRIHHNLTRPELAHKLGLSMPTVLKNITELQEAGFIGEAGKTNDVAVGRRPISFSVESTSRVSIGVDLTKNDIAMSLIDLSGATIDLVKKHHPFSPDKRYITTIDDMVIDLLKRNSVTYRHVLGMGISVPALIDKVNETISFSKIMEFDESFARELVAHWSWPCQLYNDAKAACNAEVSEHPDLANLFYISLSSNVGGAALIRNDRYLGSTSRACEIGHLTVVPNGRLCYCEQPGCMESYCNSRVLSDAADGDLQAFFTGLESGVVKYRKVWGTYTKYLVRAIKVIILLFDCPVILGGYVGEYLQPYVEDIRQQVQLQTPYKLPDNAIMACTVKKEPSAIGAGLPTIQRFWNEV